VKRRTFIAGLGGAVAAWPVVGRTQQPSPVIGFLSAQSADDDYKNITIPFLQGLKDAGYVEGQNVAIEYRWAEGQPDRLAVLATDLVRRRVAVIMAVGTAEALAAKAATSTVPIVFGGVGVDPVALGLVASLNRPGANVTGIATLQVELGPKQLQLLRELTPNSAASGVLADPAFPSTLSIIAELQTATRTLGLQLNVVTGQTAISKRPSPVLRSSALVRSWSAPVTFTAAERNNSLPWRLAMRCPRSSHSVSTPWLAA
jgi:putative ABC transport system substrate-binding protein